ncbi:DUF3152 domain-containing protein [Cellulomonas cellasea]|uniref:DUF3152 domain-containing protein n=1 Tax=Cellulomonas cellasea TaxID=43670 RepID=A0A7W4YAK9_9CELL|nr:DUF3152 domain-containing protein [Cellulomonas cellasea]MBB2922703.1 hypothetical protein [Cellulomonas cellasea]
MSAPLPSPGRSSTGPGASSIGRPRPRRRVRLTALAVAVAAFCAGGATAVGALPDPGPRNAVLQAWGTVTGSRGGEPAGRDKVRPTATPTPELLGELDSLPEEPVGTDATEVSDQVLVPQLGGGSTSLERGGGPTASDLAAGLLSLDVPRSASGDLVVVPGSQAAPSPAAGTAPEVRTVRIEVEAGLDVDAGLFAYTVMATLNDPRGWGADGSMVFARTDGDAELRVVLASPALVDRMCAPLETVGKLSCGIEGSAVLNYLRWVDASSSWDGDKVAYRHYLVNHEVGHIIGHRHEYCGGPGEVAPLMQQQTGPMAPCTPNPWPFPGS